MKHKITSIVLAIVLNRFWYQLLFFIASSLRRISFVSKPLWITKNAANHVAHYCHSSCFAVSLQRINVVIL